MGEFDRAGNALVRLWDDATSDDQIDAFFSSIGVVSNWRSSRSYPLFAVRKTLEYRAKKLDGKAVVVHRLKRLPSIQLKLSIQPTMKLTKMHDVGGCRAIMDNIFTTSLLIEKYRSQRNIEFKEYDYIRNPKPDGYRSFHFAIKYRCRSTARRVFDGLRIEIQIRTKLQNYWATAVETAGTFTGQALKSNIGDEKWKRFFALASCLFAYMENVALVPGTPETRDDVIEELRTVAENINAWSILTGFGYAVHESVENAVGAQYFLVVLDLRARTHHTRGFSMFEGKKANEEYRKTEEQFQAIPQVQTVLISASSIAELKSAYPNYYLDTHIFVELLHILMDYNDEANPWR